MRIEQALDRFAMQPISRQQPLQSGQKASLSFEQILKGAQSDEGVKFSKHALLRMEQRDLSLADTERAQLNEAVQTANGKGIRDSLVLLGGKAFIVNVPNNVVVTVVGKEEMAEQTVFTNIDGVILA